MLNTLTNQWVERVVFLVARVHPSPTGPGERAVVILNQSEADTFQQFLNGERLWSWPNGRMQLGQNFPDLSIINHLVSEGFLNHDYEPTEAGRSALQSWLNSKGLPATTIIRSSGINPGPDLSPR